MKKLTKKLHINQHAIKSNLKNNTNFPVISVKTYKKNYYGYKVEINGPSTLVYSPNCPLSCGARVWLETQDEVVIDGIKVV